MSKRHMGFDGVLNQHSIVQDDKLIIQSTQDVEPIIELNKAERKEFAGYKGEFHRVASIPNVIVERLMDEGIWQDKNRLKKWLNDPDNRAFRTSTGKV